MPGYSLTHVADSRLAQDLRAGVADDRASLALRLAQIAEFDYRRLYLPAYPSMYQYCLRELKYSEDAACKRICVARAARRFPVLFATIADGRHNLSTLNMLVPHLLPETVEELVSASAGLTKDGMAHFLAHQFPRPDVPTLVEPIPATLPVRTLSSPEATESLELSARGGLVPSSRHSRRSPWYRLRRVLASHRSPPSATLSRSRFRKRRTTSCARRRPCSRTRCRPAMSRKCSTGPWTP